MFCLLFAVMLFPVSAFADVIYEPTDEFYEKHRNECVHENEVYSAMGPENCAVFYKSPENKKINFTLENGESIRIIEIYTDKKDISWGYADSYKENRAVSGWVPMEYMWKEYNSDMFFSQYRDQIKNGNRTINKDGTVEKINFWVYPGSESCFEYTPYEDFKPNVQNIFTDEQGREWGFIGYYMGRWDAWIFMDDPGADFKEIYPDAAPERDMRVKPGAESETSNDANDKKNEKAKEQKNTDLIKEDLIVPDSGTDRTTLIICCAAVAVVVIVTVILLVCLKKRKSKLKP